LFITFSSTKLIKFISAAEAVDYEQVLFLKKSLPEQTKRSFSKF